jgi:hypothetical protein
LRLPDIAHWPCWTALSPARPSHGNVAPWRVMSPPKLQHAPPTLLMPSLARLPPIVAVPQRVRRTSSSPVPIAYVQEWPPRVPRTPQSVLPPCVDVVCWPCRPKPSLALQLPVVAAPPRAPRASSSPARIANMQERPHIAVAVKSGGQARRGGSGSKATGR